MCLTFLNGFHGVFPGIHMKAGNLVSKKGLDRSVAVCPFYTLIYHCYTFCTQGFYGGKAPVLDRIMLLQKLILAFPADRHNLFIKLLDTAAVKFIVSHGAKRR